MKTRTKVLISTIIATVVIAGGYLLVKHNAKPTKQDYVTFLKEHEQEMTDYVKSEKPKVASVQWNWNSVEIRETGDWLGVDGKVLEINGKLNENENSNFYMKFDLDEKGNIAFKSMWIPIVSYNEGDGYE